MSDISGTLPISFVSTGDNLSAWSLTSTAERLGTRVGKNYLRQVEGTMPDGTYGKNIDVSGWISARTGTFNSGDATNIGFRFQFSDSSAITPADIGTFTISDGETEVELDIFSGHIGRIWIDEGNYALSVQCGDDGTGRVVVYSSGDVSAIGKLCYTKKCDLTPNTEYTFTRTGGSENIRIQYYANTDIGHVNTTWSAPLNSIPGNQNPDKNIEQWTTMDSSVRVWINASIYEYFDSRPTTYEYCSYFADLPAGHYKAIAEGYGNNWGYTRMRNSDMSEDQTPYMALIDENDNAIIPRRMIFQDTSSPFHHEEYEFTISEPTKVGLYFKAIDPAQSNYHNYSRFMIVDYDVVAQPFTIDLSGGGTLSGVTCWEPYRVELPIKIRSASGQTTVNVDLCADYLYPGRTVTSLMSTTVIPTYYGRNSITCDSGSPVMYIQYTPLDVVIESRPGVISVYDINEPQLGFQHNGLAILMPSEVTSDKEDKGRWELTLKHPIDKYGKWTYIVGQNVLKVNGQLYRIVETEMYLDAKQEYVYARAKHISYDMADYWVNEAEINASNGTDYVLQLMAARVNDFPNQQHIIGEYSFDVTSDLDGPIQNKLQDQSIISALFGSDNSLASFGGQVYRDNFHISVNKHMEGAPEGHAFAIRYGTDLTKISFKIDFSEWITNLIGVDNFGSLVAVWYDTSGDWIVHHHKTKRVHFTYSEMGDPDSSVERLDKDVMTLWGEVSTPKISIVVSVASIKQDPRYKDFVDLQNYDVGYIGTVYVEHLGIDVEMRIVAIKRNELTGEAIQITLGNTRNSLIRQTVLSQTITNPNSTQGKVEANMQREIDNLQLKQMSTWGGCKRYTWAQLKKYKWEEIKNGRKNN